MSWFSDLYRSAVGKKAVMAVTGIILFGFVAGAHDRQPEAVRAGRRQRRGRYLNDYGTFLRQVGSAGAARRAARCWIARLVLLAAVVLHIWAAWQVTRMSRAARPRGYASRHKVHTTYASRTMRWGGVIILLFVVYHLLHFTSGTVHPGVRGGDVYRNVVAGFSALVWRCSTSWPRSPSASTSTTGSGACSSRWAGTIRASTAGAAASPTPSPGSSPSATSRSRWPC